MISPDPRETATRMLIDWDGDNRAAAQGLMPLVYEELRTLARRYLRQERRDHTLQATGLVHEAYLRLVDETKITWRGRAHFFSVAATVMRRVLVDYARSHDAAKRGGALEKIELEEDAVFSREREVDVVALDEALKKLGNFDPRQTHIIELRFFGGLTVEEAAEVLGISPRTVKREWRLARSWLRREIMRDNGHAVHHH